MLEPDYRDAKEGNMALRASDWVEIRSKEEILQTLDKNGRLENLPFTPQMFQIAIINSKSISARTRAAIP